jgi:anaerobic selenocysteine-containing dehydrogenase
MKALSALDLLLVVDPRLTTTARLAHFVVAPTLHYERSDHTGPMERLFQVPFGSYTPSLVAPPIGADVVDESYALWSVAKSAGVQLSIGDQPLALDAAPSREWLLDLLAKEARVPLAVVRSNSGGGIYGDSRRFIAPRTTTHRFELMSADVAMELAEVVRELGHRGRESGDGRQPFQLIVRRHREVMNSLGTDFESTQRRYPGNPAYLHPDDARALKLSPGNLVQISRNDRSILACVRLDGDLRRGTVAVGHGWFGHSSRPFDATNALVDAEEAQSINRMPAMTGIAVWIRRVEQSSFGSG